MVQKKTEGRHDGDFILTEANGYRSRATGTLESGYDLPAGTVLGILTSGGKLTPVDNDAGDGSQTAVGILLNGTNTSSTGLNADVAVTYIARDAEVNGNLLEWPSSEDAGDKTANLADLLALGIIVR